MATRVIAMFLFFLGGVSFASQKYVSSYAPGSGTGTIGSPWTLAQADTHAVAGDTVNMRAGTYTSGIRPLNSGSSGSPIVWRQYQSEVCSLYVGGPCIDINDKDHIIIQGLRIQKSLTNDWYVVYVTSSDHVAILNCKIYGGAYQNEAWKGAWPSVYLNQVNYLRFIGNWVDRQDDDVLTTSDTHRGDAINLYGSASDTKFNIVAACTVMNASHYAICVPYGVEGGPSYNIVQNNVVYNSHVGFGAIDQNELCLFEGNRSYSPSQMLTYRWGYSFEGTSVRGIFRYNMFYDDSVGYDNNESGLYTANASMTQGPVSLDSANRYYNNLFMGASRDPNEWHSFAAISDAGMGGYNTGRSVMVNNIFGPPVDGYSSVPYFWKDADNLGVNRDTLRYNLLWTGHISDTLFTFEHGSTYRYTLANVTAAEPTVEASNIEGSPLWVDSLSLRGARSFELSAISPCVNAGGPLATVASGSSAKIVAVSDAGFFCYDWGASPYASGDSVLIGTDRCKLDSVDYVNHNLILVDNATVVAGDEVHIIGTWNFQTLTYTSRLSGSAPDIGPYESGAVTETIPDTVSVVSPLYGSTQSQPTTLRWHPVSGATKYWLSLSTDGWATLDVNNATITDTTYVVSGLDTSATVLWNMAAGNSAGWSAWNSDWKYYTSSAGATSNDTLTLNWNDVAHTDTLTGNTYVTVSNVQRVAMYALIKNPTGYGVTWATSITWPSGVVNPGAGQEALYVFFNSKSKVYGAVIGIYSSP